MFLSRKYSITINNESSKEKQNTLPIMSNSIKNHIDENIPYFSKIVGSHVKNHSDLTSQDIILLREAYDKSHASKNFEIELYWKRATYTWTLIAALITFCGLLINPYFTKDKDDGLIFVAFVTSVIGILVTIVCNLIIESGERWKKNWEVHTALLEPLFSGSLYATHVVSSENRLSIAKLNNALYLMFLFIWILIIESIIAMKFDSDIKAFVYSVFIFLIFVLSFTRLINKTTHSKNDDINVIITGYKIKLHKTELDLKEKKHKIRRSILKSVLYFIATGLILSLMFLKLVLNYSFSQIFSSLALW